MPIERGEEWGSAAVLPADAVVCASDAAACRAIEAQRGEPSTPTPVVALAGGDLCSTLGGRGDVAERRGNESRLLPCDLGVVTCGSDRHLFVAHCLVVPSSFLPGRLSWLRGPLVAAMNAAWLGNWNVAPKAHPGDGRLDVVKIAATMTMSQRVEAQRRASHGGHVPHPGISVTRTRPGKPVEVELPAGLHLVIDGEDRGPAQTVTFETIDEAFLAAV